MSPESIVSTGLSEASKKPRCTVVGDAFSSCIFSSHCTCAAETMTTAPRQIPKACDLMFRSFKAANKTKPSMARCAGSSQMRLHHLLRRPEGPEWLVPAEDAPVLRQVVKKPRSQDSRI